MHLPFVILLVCLAVKQQPKPVKSSLTGTWKIVADQEVNAAGKVIKQDKDVDGLIIYTANGKMSSQFFWRGRRQPIMTDSIMNHDGFSDGLGTGNNTWALAQAHAIIDTYDAYFGDYVVDWKNHIVTHIISGNIRPEKPGTTYKRKFELKGDSLFLSSTDPKMRWRAALVRLK